MATNKKHTPGPWKTNGESVYCTDTHHMDAEVARANSHWFPRQAAANAQLIASAPDLLAERDRLREQNARLVKACELAKARWDFVLKNFPRRSWKHGDQESYDAVSAALAAAKAEQ